MEQEATEGQIPYKHVRHTKRDLCGRCWVNTGVRVEVKQQNNGVSSPRMCCSVPAADNAASLYLSSVDGFDQPAAVRTQLATDCVRGSRSAAQSSHKQANS